MASAAGVFVLEAFEQAIRVALFWKLQLKEVGLLRSTKNFPTTQHSKLEESLIRAETDIDLSDLGTLKIWRYFLGRLPTKSRTN